MYDVVCAGSAALDDYYVVSRLPRDDEKVPSRYVGQILGGPTCNTAKALKVLGAKALLVTPVGDDEQGPFVRRKLAEIGLDTVYVTGPGIVTGHTLVMASEQGEKAILTFGRPNAEGLAAAFGRLELPPARVVQSMLATTMTTYLERWTDTPVVVNIEEQILNSFPDAFDWANQHAHTMVLDRHAYVRLFKLPETVDSLQQVVAAHPGTCANIIVTMGAQGSMGVSREDGSAAQLPAYPAHVVDPTGAGDIFISAFIHGHYLQGMALAETLRYANAIASASCEDLGTDLSPKAVQRAQKWLR